MKINLNYSVIEKNSNTYITYSDKIQEIINALKQSKSNIKDNWEATNSDTFDAILDRLIANMQVDANKMKRYGNIMLGVKDNFTEEDLKYSKELTIEQPVVEMPDEEQ